MRPIIVIGHDKPIVMEIIGQKGQKVAEYVDKGDKPRKYQVLHESICL